MKVLSLFLLLILTATEASADITAREALSIARSKLLDTYFVDAYYLKWTLVKNEPRWEYLSKTTVTRFKAPPEEIKAGDFLKTHDYWGVFIWGENTGHIDFYIDCKDGKIIYSEPDEEFISKYMKYKVDVGDALKIADRELIKRKYNPQNMVQVVEEATYPTLHISLKSSKPVTDMVDAKNLKDRFTRVWEVYYHPNEDFKKGDIIIIIDSDTGNIEYVFE